MAETSGSAWSPPSSPIRSSLAFDAFLAIPIFAPSDCSSDNRYQVTSSITKFGSGVVKFDFCPRVFGSESDFVAVGYYDEELNHSLRDCASDPLIILRRKGKMRGVQGGESRPKQDTSEMESEGAQQMRKAGFERAQAEDWNKKGFVEKLQTSTNNIKDTAAEQMDKMGEVLKNSSAATSAEK